MVEREKNPLVIKAYQQIVREVQAEFKSMLPDRNLSMVDALLAERRAEVVLTADKAWSKLALDIDIRQIR